MFQTGNNNSVEHSWLEYTRGNISQNVMRPNITAWEQWTIRLEIWSFAQDDRKMMQWHRELATSLAQPKKNDERMRPTRKNIFGEEIFEFDERKGSASESIAGNN